MVKPAKNNRKMNLPRPVKKTNKAASEKQKKNDRKSYPLRIARKTYKALEILARKEHRKVNAQIEHVLERWIKEYRG